MGPLPLVRRSSATRSSSYPARATGKDASARNARAGAGDGLEAELHPSTKRVTIALELVHAVPDSLIHPVRFVVEVGAFEEDLDVLRDLVADLRIPLVEAVDIDVVIRAFAGLAQRGRAIGVGDTCRKAVLRSEEHTSELQSLMRNSYTVFCLKKKKTD